MRNINPPDESRTATGRNHPAASRGGRGEPHRMEDITMKTIEKRVKAEDPNEQISFMVPGGILTIEI